VLVGRTLVALPTVALGEVWRAMAPRAYHEVRVVDESGGVLGTLGEGALYAGLVRLGPTATLGDLLGDGG
jgi:hypothetical protein